MEPDETWGLPPNQDMEEVVELKGLSKLERRRKRQKRGMAHSLVGTPNYIAPEVLRKSGESPSSNSAAPFKVHD